MKARRVPNRFWFSVWRETGAVRNARPSRGQAASTRKTQGLDTAKIDEAMGRSGQKTVDVYRLGFPRTDLHVSVAGVEIKPGLALGSWAAFTGNDNEAMVMGDLVLLENELTPVMK